MHIFVINRASFVGCARCLFAIVATAEHKAAASISSLFVHGHSDDGWCICTLQGKVKRAIWDFLCIGRGSCSIRE